VTGDPTRLPRMYDWILFAIFLVVTLWIIRTPSMADYLAAIGIPGDIIVLVHKAATIALGAIGGMYLDRSAFPYGRPNAIVRDPDDAEPWNLGDAVAFTGACIRRAIVMSAFMFAAGLAL
jgi:putative holin